MKDAELLVYLQAQQDLMRRGDMDSLNNMLLEAMKTTDKMHIIAALRGTYVFRDKLPDWNNLLDYATSTLQGNALIGLEKVHK